MGGQVPAVHSNCDKIRTSGMMDASLYHFSLPASNFEIDRHGPITRLQSNRYCSYGIARLSRWASAIVQGIACTNVRTAMEPLRAFALDLIQVALPLLPWWNLQMQALASESVCHVHHKQPNHHGVAERHSRGARKPISGCRA
jgi:hypothetical protein